MISQNPNFWNQFGGGTNNYRGGFFEKERLHRLYNSELQYANLKAVLKPITDNNIHDLIEVLITNKISLTVASIMIFSQRKIIMLKEISQMAAQA